MIDLFAIFFDEIENLMKSGPLHLQHTPSIPERERERPFHFELLNSILEILKFNFDVNI